MRINEITYYDREFEWRFEPIQFSVLTLLVGISGVGKTQILKAIVTMRSIAKGKSLNGVKWDICFTANNNSQYHWVGEFETKKLDNFDAFILEDILDGEENEEQEFQIIYESLSVNGEILIKRDDKGIKFKDKFVPKLSRFQSAVSLLSEEPDIAPVQDSFNQIIYSDQSSSVDAIYPTIKYASLTQKYSSLTLCDLKGSNLPVQIKLALVYDHFPNEFNLIKENFIEIFNQVEDIKLRPDENEDLHLILTEYPFVKIKEKGVNTWINQHRISSGMFKILMLISAIYLSTEGTVILIDEFENSLGVNCINVLSDLLAESRNLQFIITSHHPYIINKVGMEHWKIVTRKGGVVTAKDAKDLGLGKSRHEAFMQLINLDEYNEGISA
jgi:predicted ATPase